MQYLIFRNRLVKALSAYEMMKLLSYFEQTADSDTVSTYQVSSVQWVIDKRLLEAFNKAKLRPSHLWDLF